MELTPPRARDRERFTIPLQGVLHTDPLGNFTLQLDIESDLEHYLAEDFVLSEVQRELGSDQPIEFDDVNPDDRAFITDRKETIEQIIKESGLKDHHPALAVSNSPEVQRHTVNPDTKVTVNSIPANIDANELSVGRLRINVPADVQLRANSQLFVAFSTPTVKDDISAGTNQEKTDSNSTNKQLLELLQPVWIPSKAYLEQLEKLITAEPSQIPHLFSSPFRQAPPTAVCAASDIYWFNTDSTVYETRVTGTNMEVIREFKARSGLTSNSGYGDIAVSPDNRTLWGIEFSTLTNASGGDRRKFRLDEWDVSDAAARKVRTYEIVAEARDVVDFWSTLNAAGELNALSYSLDAEGRPRLLTATAKRDAIFAIYLDELKVGTPYILTRNTGMTWPSGHTSAGDFVTMPNGDVFGFSTRDRNTASNSYMVKWVGGTGQGQILGELQDGTFGGGRVGDKLIFTRAASVDLGTWGSKFFWHQFDASNPRSLVDGTIPNPPQASGWTSSIWGATAPGDGAPACDEIVVEVRKHVYSRNRPTEQYLLAAESVTPGGTVPQAVVTDGPTLGLQTKSLLTLATRGTSLTLSERLWIDGGASPSGLNLYNTRLVCIRKDKSPSSPERVILDQLWKQDDKAAGRRSAGLEIPIDLAPSSTRARKPQVECTFYNGVTLLSLNKVMELPSDGDPQNYSTPEDWVLHAQGPEAAKVSVRGTKAQTLEEFPVAPGNFTLSEAHSPTDGSTPATDGYSWTKLSCYSVTTNGEKKALDSKSVKITKTGPSITDASVSATPNSRVSCIYTNTPKPGSISWQKIDSLDADQQNPVSLAGSEWRLEGPKGFTPRVITDSKDSPGNFEAQNLPWGTYRLVETKAPVGYIPNSEPISFELSGSRISFDLGRIPNDQDIQFPGTLPLVGGRGLTPHLLIAFLLIGIGVLSAVRRPRRAAFEN